MAEKIRPILWWSGWVVLAFLLGTLVYGYLVVTSR